VEVGWAVRGSFRFGFVSEVGPEGAPLMGRAVKSPENRPFYADFSPCGGSTLQVESPTSFLKNTASRMCNAFTAGLFLIFRKIDFFLSLKTAIF
jgi:hypothetical protein